LEPLPPFGGLGAGFGFAMMAFLVGDSGAAVKG
jgi:hypothetical protein